MTSFARWPAGALVALGLALGAACADPSLRIVVEHPSNAPELVKMVQRVEISVYERDGLTCDDIAFRKLSDEELQATLRSRGEGAVASIPRLGRKAVVARAYSLAADLRSERLVLAGCTEIDEIVGEDRVVITTEPVANAAADLRNLGSRMAIVVIAVDARQAPISGKEVSWTTYGPMPPSGDDLLEPGTPAKLTNGEVTISPAAPVMAGPYAVQVRVKWANALPPLIASAVAGRVSTLPLPSGALPVINACTIFQRQGQPTLVCLAQTPTGRVARAFTFGAAGLAPAVDTPVPTAIGLFGMGNDVAVVHANGTYTALAGDFPAGSICEGACGALMIIDVLGFAGCRVGVAGLFAALRDGTQMKTRFVATPLPGGPKVSFPAIDDVPVAGAIGCVTDLDTNAAPHIAATLDTQTINYIFPFFASAVPIIRERERRLPGTGFAPAGPKGSQEARILTTEVDATGFVVVESVLAKPRDQYLLFERRRSPAVAPPRHYVSGSFDADDEVDLAWDSLEDLGQPARSVQILLGARPGRPALSARLPLPDTADLLAADLDGDGISEIIGYSTASVSVLRLGAK